MFGIVADWSFPRFDLIFQLSKTSSLLQNSKILWTSLLKHVFRRVFSSTFQERLPLSDNLLQWSSKNDLPISSVLLLETVPEQQPQQRSTGSISDGPSSSIDIDGLQHDGRPHSPLKLFWLSFLSLIYIPVQLDLSKHLSSVKPPKERERYTITK